MHSAGPLQSFYRLSIQLLLDQPFFGLLLLPLPKKESDQVKNLSLQRTRLHTFGLLVHPQFGNSSPEKAYGLILHELLHLVFQHPLPTIEMRYPQLYDIAADIVVNQYIPVAQRPDEAITMANYPDLGFPQQQSTLFYYKKLIAAQAQGIDLISRLTAMQFQQLQKHHLWRTTPEQASLIRPIVTHYIQQALQQTSSNQWGTLPAQLQTFLKTTYAQKKTVINWPRRLRLFCTKSKRTYLKNTIHRPSKRYGSVPGIKIRNRNRILVALDTSGSISQKDFQHFFQEIHHIWQTGAEVQIVECDMQVQQHYPYHGVIPRWISGRGGTAFDPAIRWAKENGPFDALIYLTDGHGPSPKVKVNCPILWLIAPGGIEPKHPNWFALGGQKVKMQYA